MSMRSLPAPRPAGDIPRRTTFVTHVSSRPVASVMPPRTMIDNAVYRDGLRIATPATTADTARVLREQPGAMGWIGLYQPEPSDLESLGEEFGLHELALEDAIQAHQRSKIERYDDTLFVVLRAARYLEIPEEVEVGELHVFVGPNFIITVRHGGSPDLSRVRRRMETDAEMLARGPEAVLYAILDAVVDGYVPVLAGLANDIEEIEDEVFSGNTQVSRRIYELSQEVVEFQRAVKPLRMILAGLAAGSAKYQVGEELQEYLRDVADHTADAADRIEGFRVTLRDILTLNATLVAQRQNEEMKNLAEASNDQNEEVKKISAWAGILFAPTLISSLYGMNFIHMPELLWELGYAFAIALMLASSLLMWLIFRRKGWI